MPKLYRLINITANYIVLFNFLKLILTLKRLGTVDLVVLWPMKLISSRVVRQQGDEFRREKC